MSSVVKHIGPLDEHMFFSWWDVFVFCAACLYLENMLVKTCKNGLSKLLKLINLMEHSVACETVTNEH
jgi:hypothetical protein